MNIVNLRLRTRHTVTYNWLVTSFSFYKYYRKLKIQLEHSKNNKMFLNFLLIISISH